MWLLFLILVPLDVLAGVQWTECARNSTGNTLIQLGANGVAGIRTYDWPNSMTMDNGDNRFGPCGFKIESPTKQKIALFALSAHASINKTTIADTNDNYVGGTYPEILQFSIGRGSLPTAAAFKWFGLEAIVGAFDNEAKCPFETDGAAPQIISDTSPTLVASNWDFGFNFNGSTFVPSTVPNRACNWHYAPGPGETLKLHFRVINFLHTAGESLLLFENQNLIFNSSEPKPLSSMVFYTENSFKIVYRRMERPNGFNANHFFAVLSAFPSSPVSETTALCALNTTLTIDKKLGFGDRSFANIDDNALRGFYKPYADKQECNWHVKTIPGKELQFYQVTIDIEQPCDALTLKTNSALFNLPYETSDGKRMLSTVGSELASIHWKSDGNYGRSGFRVNARVLDCDCGGNSPITLSETTKSAKFAPAPIGVISQNYCSNMKCDWKISAPPNAVLLLSLKGKFRDAFGDFLQITDDKSTQKVTSTPQADFFFLNTTVSVQFTSSSKLPRFDNQNGDLVLKASFLDLKSLTNSVQTLQESKDTVFFRMTDIHEQYASVTFALGDRISSKRLQLFLQDTAFLQNADTEDLLILDGDLNSIDSITSLAALARKVVAAQTPTDQRFPFTSTNGKITVVLLHKPVQRAGVIPTVYIKVFDESRDCEEAGQVYYLSPNRINHVYTAQSINKDAKFCPITVVGRSLCDFPAASIHVNNLEDTKKAVKVTPGQDYDTEPLYQFTSGNVAKWTNAKLYGSLFSILVPIGGRMNFSVTLDCLPNDSRDYSENARNGIFMSPSYPYGGADSQVVRTSFNITTLRSEDFKVKFDLVIRELAQSSTVKVWVDSKLFLSKSGVSKPIKTTYHTGSTKNVKFEYEGIAGEKGFLIRYEPTTGSGNSATSERRFWIWVGVFAVALLSC